jgi:hypothetical protein
MSNDEPLTGDEIYSHWERVRSQPVESVAEAHFLASIFVGEARLKKVGKLEMFEKSKTLPGYTQAVESVKVGFQRFCEITYRIKKDAHWGEWETNRAMFLDGARRAPDSVSKIRHMHTQTTTFLAALLRGDLDFFREFGIAISAQPLKSSHELTHTLLNHWITDFLWLMDASSLTTAVAFLEKSVVPAKGKQFKSQIDKIEKARDRAGLFFRKPAVIKRFLTRCEFDCFPRVERIFP